MAERESPVDDAAGEAAADIIEALKMLLAEEAGKAATNLDGWQRAQADFANYKKRTEQVMSETGVIARAGLIRAILPVVDDVERALQNVPAELAGEQWVEGVQMISRKLGGILDGQGLASIKALGEPFDPIYHEAVLQAPGEDGIVVSELEKGYMLGERVVRHSKVAVGNGEPAGAADGQ
jgi:molecular chaperone GrpE